MDHFQIVSPFKAAGDQVQAIQEIANHFKNGEEKITLIGVTGSGKTFTMAEVISALNLPTLILSHNKTLAAQLFREFKEFFSKQCCRIFCLLL
jgi:excinuclease ABC subunit B